MIIRLDSADSANVSISWADLGAATIQSVTYSSNPSLTLTPMGVSGTVSTVRLAGLTHGAMYALEAAATLSTGEILNRNVSVRCFNG